MNAFLVCVLLLLLGLGFFVLPMIDIEPPWPIIVTGACLAFLFFLVTGGLTSVKLVVDDRGVLLKSLFWSKHIPFAGGTVEKIIRPIGITAVRVRSATGEKLWLSASWFEDFDELHRSLEKYATDAGGKVTLAGK